MPSAPLWSYLAKPILHCFSPGDAAVNFLAYVPLGALLVWTWRRLRPATAVLLATAAGTLLSFTMETLQRYVPGRDSSPIDIITNGTCALCGAIVAAASQAEPIRQRVRRITAGIHSDPAAITGLGALMLWAVSALCPFIPVLHRARLTANLYYARHAVHGTDLRPYQFAAYLAYMAGAMLLVKLFSRSHTIRVWTLPAVGACILAIQPFIYKHSLSLEAIAGVGVGALFYAIVRRSRFISPARASALLLMIGFLCDELQPQEGGFSRFNWLPFHLQNQVRLASFGDMLAIIWPFVALASLARMASPAKARRRNSILGGAAVAAIVFGCQLAELRIPGRCPDITSVLLALTGWALPWFLPAAAETKSCADERCALRTHQKT